MQAVPVQICIYACTMCAQGWMLDKLRRQLEAIRLAKSGLHSCGDLETAVSHWPVFRILYQQPGQYRM
jgi:hypothetical protein